MNRCNPAPLQPTSSRQTLDASVLFDVDESELTDAGKEALRNVLPIYCKVLMEDTYKNYLAEIIIDGYTDTDGDYAYNLELSQQRSLAVAQYLLDIQGYNPCIKYILGERTQLSIEDICLLSVYRTK